MLPPETEGGPGQGRGACRKTGIRSKEIRGDGNFGMPVTSTVILYAIVFF